MFFYHAIHFWPSKMNFIGFNMDIAGSRTIKWNFINIKDHCKTVQVKGYYIPDLGETLLVPPQSYFRMECVDKMKITMYME